MNQAQLRTGLDNNISKSKKGSERGYQSWSKSGYRNESISRGESVIGNISWSGDWSVSRSGCLSGGRIYSRVRSV